MKQLILFGSGGYAYEVFSYWCTMQLHLENEFVFKGYLDCKAETAKIFTIGSFLGHESDYQPQPNDVFLLGLSDIDIRHKIIVEYLSQGLDSINVIHPTATIDPSAKLGVGNVIGPHCHVGAQVELGNHNVLNYGCSLGHNSCLSDNNVLASNTQLAGYVQLGSDNFFGISVSIVPRTQIGNGNKVQAGTTVTQNIPNNAFYYHRDTNKMAFIFTDQPTSTADLPAALN